MINFDVSREDHELITKIVKRGFKLAIDNDIEVGDFQNALMDITACHANGCPLDLAGFLGMDDSNFGHDFFGISRFLDRRTGKLTECFDPRCSKRAQVTT